MSGKSTRREFLRRSAMAAAGVFAGCGPRPATTDAAVERTDGGRLVLRW